MIATCMSGVGSKPKNLAQFCWICPILQVNKLCVLTVSSESPMSIYELVEVQEICWRNSLAKLTKTLEIVSTVSASPTSSPNAVPWWNFPAHAPALLPKSSIILPTVIRDGNPWGFIIKSGQTPLSLKGMSSCRTMLPTTPFCPCRLLNLSPSSGRLVCLIKTYWQQQKSDEEHMLWLFLLNLTTSFQRSNHRNFHTWSEEDVRILCIALPQFYCEDDMILFQISLSIESALSRNKVRVLLQFASTARCWLTIAVSLVKVWQLRRRHLLFPFCGQNLHKQILEPLGVSQFSCIDSGIELLSEDGLSDWYPIQTECGLPSVKDFIIKKFWSRRFSSMSWGNLCWQSSSAVPQCGL